VLSALAEMGYLGEVDHSLLDSSVKLERYWELKKSPE
jgi:hypothetical protein